MSNEIEYKPCPFYNASYKILFQRAESAEAELAALKADDGWIDRRVEEPPKVYSITPVISVWDDETDTLSRVWYNDSKDIYDNECGREVHFTFWRNRPQKPKALS